MRQRCNKSEANCLSFELPSWNSHQPKQFRRKNYAQCRLNINLKNVLSIILICILLLFFSAIKGYKYVINSYYIKSHIVEINSNSTFNAKHYAAVQQSLKDYSSLCEGTRWDSLHSTIVYNKAFVAMADVQTSTVIDASGEEHVYSRTQTTTVADQILHDNILYVHRDQGITNAFVKTFVELMTKQETNEDEELSQLIIVYVMNTFISQFVLRCLKEQAHVLLPPNVEVSKRRKFVLVTGNTDEPASYTFYKDDMDKLVNIERDLLDHPLLHHWFSENGDIIHPKFTTLPIGADFRTLARQISRECHQTPPEQSLQIIEPLLKEIDVKRLLPSYVNLHSVDLHPRFAPGESDDEQFDFSEVDWALIPKKANKLTHVQELKWTSFDKLDDAGLKMLSEMEVDFSIIMEGVSRNNSRQYEQYYTADNDNRANNNQEFLSRIALQRIDDQQDKDRRENMNRIMLHATLSEMYMYALRTNGFGHPTLRETKVMLTFTWRHYEFIRLPIYSFLKGHLNDFAVDGRVKRNKMWSMMHKYAFVASPPGTGYDCHRTWEALALGCIPIVIHPSKYKEATHKYSYRHHRNGVAVIDVNASLELYDDLPVVIVNNFEKEVNMNSLRQWEREIYDKNVKGEYYLHKLLNQYWLDRFLDRV